METLSARRARAGGRIWALLSHVLTPGQSGVKGQQAVEDPPEHCQIIEIERVGAGHRRLAAWQRRSRGIDRNCCGRRNLAPGYFSLAGRRGIVGGGQAQGFDNVEAPAALAVKRLGLERGRLWIAVPNLDDEAFPAAGARRSAPR